MERYHRQIILPGFGEAAQNKLQQAKILVIGAGGLGCPALQYLAAAGVGTIGIVDYDAVDYSNLHRQTLYSASDVGKLKAETAAKKINELNADIQIDAYSTKLDNSNALDIIANYSLVLDGTDNFATRYLVNDACVLLDKPLIYGAVLRFEGQAGVFNLADGAGLKTNYRDLFPQPPLPSDVPSCAGAGVLGVLPGIIGTLQATEALKIIANIGKPLCNMVITYNILTNRFYEFTVTPCNKNNYLVPKNSAEFAAFNYDWFCNLIYNNYEISVSEFDALRLNESIMVIDVREQGEFPPIDEFECINIPLGQITDYSIEDCSAENIILICQSGKRSAHALEIMRKKYAARRILSLQGGISEWKKHNSAIRK